MRTVLRVGLVLAALLISSAAGAQSLCRLYVAGQYDWAGNRGGCCCFEPPTVTDLPNSDRCCRHMPLVW